MPKSINPLDTSWGRETEQNFVAVQDAQDGKQMSGNGQHWGNALYTRSMLLWNRAKTRSYWHYLIKVSMLTSKENTMIRLSTLLHHEDTTVLLRYYSMWELT